MSESYGKANQAMAYLGTEEALIMEGSNNYQCRKEGNNLHIVKLVLIVHFLAHNNLPAVDFQKYKI